MSQGASGQGKIGGVTWKKNMKKVDELELQQSWAVSDSCVQRSTLTFPLPFPLLLLLPLYPYPF
jgi:hypothetical protein